MFKTGLGQDSHRFEEKSGKLCRLGGVTFDGVNGLQGNSDSDVVLHAICNALTGIHGTPVLGPITDEMCKSGIKDSAEYVKIAYSFFPKDYKLTHVSISIECLKPKIIPKMDDMKAAIAKLLPISEQDIGITATTGEGLTDFGKGLGVQAFVIASAVQKDKW
jgi:2-C-methyl-D-erythritol 2,4-cyclodiphosphate synthase